MPGLEGQDLLVDPRFRLKGSKDFMRVRQFGRSYAHPLVVLITLPNQLNQTRIGVNASKSVGGAVQRNRAKRLLRAAVTPIIPSIIPGSDLILLARKPILEKKSHEVQKALAHNLKKANLLTDDRSS